MKYIKSTYTVRKQMEIKLYAKVTMTAGPRLRVKSLNLLDVLICTGSLFHKRQTV